MGAAAAPAYAQTTVGDGLVNVAVGDVNVLNNARIGVAAQVAAQVCGLKVGPVAVLARTVDRSGTTTTVCQSPRARSPSVRTTDGALDQTASGSRDARPASPVGLGSMKPPPDRPPLRGLVGATQADARSDRRERRITLRRWSTRASTPYRSELTADDLTAIDTAAAAITVQGERYPEAMQRMIDR
jgi:hypothetical protein